MTGWLDLPWPDLPASVRIDVLGVLAYGKPAIRIPMRGSAAATHVAAAITAAGWSHAHDDEHLVAAPTSAQAWHVLDVDRDTQPHTLELGLLLGYPECCARAAADIGEENIDNHAKRLGEDRDRDGTPHLDPRGHATGVASPPYVACSPRCPHALRHASSASLHIATATADTTPTREPWRTWRRPLDTIPGPAPTAHMMNASAAGPLRSTPPEPPLDQVNAAELHARRAHGLSQSQHGHVRLHGWDLEHLPAGQADLGRVGESHHRRFTTLARGEPPNPACRPAATCVLSTRSGATGARTHRPRRRLGFRCRRRRP